MSGFNWVGEVALLGVIIVFMPSGSRVGRLEGVQTGSAQASGKEDEPSEGEG